MYWAHIAKEAGLSLSIHGPYLVPRGKLNPDARNPDLLSVLLLSYIHKCLAYVYDNVPQWGTLTLEGWAANPQGSGLRVQGLGFGA